MRYVLLMYWSFYGNSLSMHVSPDVITYSGPECVKAGERWLAGARRGEIQTRHAYTCQVGGTAYEVNR